MSQNYLSIVVIKTLQRIFLYLENLYKYGYAVQRKISNQMERLSR